MSAIVMGRSHSAWDVILGILVALGGLVILGNAVVATKVSILFLGWMLVFAGILGLISAFFHISSGGFWSSAITGGLSLVLGLMCLRHTEAAALTLTLIAGALFLTTGLVRLIASVENEAYRWPLAFGGAVSTILGLIVLFNLIDASFKLLGILLGIEMLVQGLTMILLGRVTFAAVGTNAPSPI